MNLSPAQIEALQKIDCAWCLQTLKIKYGKPVRCECGLDWPYLTERREYKAAMALTESHPTKENGSPND